MKKRWNKIRDWGYKIKLWIGFHILGWHKPKNFDYGYFIDPTTAVHKFRDINRITHTIMKICPKEGVDITL